MYLQNKPPSPRECGLDLMTCFHRIEYGKGKIVMLQWGDLADTILTRWANLASSILKQTDFTHRMVSCAEKNTVPLLQLFYPKVHNRYILTRNYQIVPSTN